jgi:hypothetical protein
MSSKPANVNQAKSMTYEIGIMLPPKFQPDLNGMQQIAQKRKAPNYGALLRQGGMDTQHDRPAMQKRKAAATSSRLLRKRERRKNYSAPVPRNIKSSA